MLRFIFKLFGYQIVKIPSQMDIMVDNALQLLANEYHEVEPIINKLIELEDQSQTLDFALDEISVWQKVEHEYTVESFLEEITP